MTLLDPRLAYDRLPVLLWTAGPDGACDYLNERWSDLTGRPLSEMLGWGWVEDLHPDDRDQFVAEYSTAVSARAPVCMEFRMLDVDGEYRWLLGVGEPISAADGSFLGYSGCTTDVTDRRALTQRLAQLGRTGEMAQLAGGIAHDFNNLITGIMGHVALLLDEATLSPEAQEDLARIRQAADRAATLTRQLLSFSRRPHLSPRFLDLNQLVSGTTSAIRQVVGPAVEVQSELESDLEPVLADAGQLEQILLQLGTHARASMPGGGRLTLRTGRAQLDEAAASGPGLRAGSYVTLEVSHTGAGLNPDALARVFNPPAGGAEEVVDLSSVATIARQSGGHVTVVSTPGVGTTFTLFIPSLVASPDSLGSAEGAALEGSETILLVEDDAQVRDVSRRALERAGYTVLAQSDAETAIAAADRHPGHIHLLVTDVLLPRASGRELAARLGIHRPAIKVLYVSGTSDGAIARHRMLEPGIEFLEKPFSLDRLLGKVRQILGADLSAEESASWATRSLV